MQFWIVHLSDPDISRFIQIREMKRGRSECVYIYISSLSSAAGIIGGVGVGRLFIIQFWMSATLPHRMDFRVIMAALYFQRFTKKCSYVAVTKLDSKTFAG